MIPSLPIHVTIITTTTSHCISPSVTTTHITAPTLSTSIYFSLSIPTTHITAPTRPHRRFAAIFNSTFLSLFFGQNS
ncbi:hypothetical protein L6452_36910 [Arctium lappa]|uniref:Uncharacterized protein n=1 Tax=Arctium lappa TaxID=4217 RepID=A0ACB8Y2N7_ARCLA|nr:hypothetical protein L6452_36910 [Arctium lappa]